MQTTSTRRVAFYSHDTQGLGHVRRNLALAAAIVADDPDTDVLLITGNPEATSLPRPPHTDVLTLPTICKDLDGGYDARVMRGGFANVIDIRSQVLEAALTSFDPDLLVVDKVALGIGDELEPALHSLRGRGRGRIVLGLREVLDAPDVAVREWEAARTSQSIERYYDQVWVYGDPTVYDTALEYRLPPDVAAKTVYTGYLGHGRGAGSLPTGGTRTVPPVEPYVLCLCGGGQDGVELAETFASATMPAGHRGVLVTGPFMSDDHRRRLDDAVARNDDVDLHRFVTNVEDLLLGAASVVSMAGYNSVCELLSAGARALLVPRTIPRLEQMVRATHLADLGLVDVMTPDALSPAALTAWLPATARPDVDRPVDLDGLLAVPALATALMQESAHAA